MPRCEIFNLWNLIRARQPCCRKETARDGALWFGRA